MKVIICVSLHMLSWNREKNIQHDANWTGQYFKALIIKIAIVTQLYQKKDGQDPVKLQMPQRSFLALHVSNLKNCFECQFADITMG